MLTQTEVNGPGTGVTTDGWFDPADGLVGANELTYVFNNAACPASGSMVVIVEDLPDVEAGPNQSVCENDQPFFISGGSPEKRSMDFR